MRIGKSPFGIILRIICFALIIQIVTGIIIDYNDPYMPFGVVVLFYLIIVGTPLVIMLIVASRYCKLKGESFWIRKKADLLCLFAWAFPVSGLLRLCVGLLITGQSKQAFFEESVKFLAYYLIVGIFLLAISKFIKLWKHS